MVALIMAWKKISCRKLADTLYALSFYSWLYFTNFSWIFSKFVGRHFLKIVIAVCRLDYSHLQPPRLWGWQWLFVFCTKPLYWLNLKIRVLLTGQIGTHGVSGDMGQKNVFSPENLMSLFLHYLMESSYCFHHCNSPPPPPQHQSRAGGQRK